MKKNSITTILVTMIMCITHTSQSADLNKGISFDQLPPVERAKIQLNRLRQQLKDPYYREEKETTYGGKTTHLLNDSGRKHLKIVVAKIRDLYLSNRDLSPERRSQIERLAFDILDEYQLP